ncbi:MAG: hypothetical protein WC824_07795 [Bacteroidota bacterium]|jgi:hypothetical protein
MFRSISIVLFIIMLSGIHVHNTTAQVNVQDDYSRFVVKTTNAAPPPYINLSMPLNVLATYIVADTLCKSFDFSVIDSIADALSADSIDIAYRAIIAAQDYNPLLFKHALFKTTMIGEDNYSSNYGALFKGIERNYFSRVRPAARYDSIRFKASGGIYHVKVRNQESVRDSTNPSPSFYAYQDNFHAELQVLAPIIGINTNFNCIDDASGATYPCLYTSWVRYPIEHEPKIFSEMDYEKIGPGLLIPGREYIVLLTAWARNLTSDGGIEFQVYPNIVLSVSDGIVLDPDNFFGLGTEFILRQFIDTVRSRILLQN